MPQRLRDYMWTAKHRPITLSLGLSVAEVMAVGQDLRQRAQATMAPEQTSYGVPGVPSVMIHNHMPGQPEQVVTTEQGQIYFTENEPQTFADFEGQEHIIKKLEMQLQGMPEGTRVLRPQLFRGIAGMGKTLIAKVTANEVNRAAAAKGLVQGMWIEVFPESFDNLDAVVQVAQKYPGSTLFFDEIHGLDPSEALRLYELLANGRYQFRGCTQATLLPPTQIMGATTDYGSLHSALKRRFEAHDIRPATIEEMEAILARRTTLPAAAALSHLV